MDQMAAMEQMAMMNMMSQMGMGMGGGGGNWNGGGKGKGKGKSKKGVKQVMKKVKAVAPQNLVKPDKIKGTEVQLRKGGVYVRVVTADGKEFPPTANKAVIKHLKSIGQDPTPPQAMKKVKGPTPEEAQAQKKAKGKGPTQPGQGVKKKVKGTPKQAPPKPRTAEEEEARRQKMVEKAEAMLLTENRQMVSNSYHTGEIVQAGGTWMWVKPDNPSKITGPAKAKLQKMNEEMAKKKKADGKTWLDGSKVNAVYVRLADMLDTSLKVEKGVKVQFKLYTDNKGVGGCDVMAA